MERGRNSRKLSRSKRDVRFSVKNVNITQCAHVSVPNLTKMKTSEITIEAAATTARLTIPNSVFKSDVGKIRFILLLIEEIVSDFREQKGVRVCINKRNTTFGFGFIET